MSTAADYLKDGIVLPHGAVSAVAMIYVATLAYFTARLAWSLWRTLLLAKNAAPIDGGIQIRWRAVTTAFGIKAEIAESREAYGPSTVGLRNGLLLLPDGFAERTTEEDLTAVMAHECAHLVRRDFAKNLLYSLIALPCAFHPATWLMQARLSESREMVCDAIAAEMLGDPKKYARSLLRLVSGMVERVPRNVHAIGIFDANHLERRIMILTGRKAPSAGALRAVTFAACVAIGFGTCASALTLRTEIGTEPNGTTGNGRPMAKDAAHLSMPVLISSKAPEYPAKGKQAHLSGICLVGLTVDQQGMPQDVHIIRSLRPDFDQNATEAVRKYRFNPAMADGKPVARQLTIEVKFAYF
jgi:TonB family protein